MPSGPEPDSRVSNMHLTLTCGYDISGGCWSGTRSVPADSYARLPQLEEAGIAGSDGAEEAQTDTVLVKELPAPVGQIRSDLLQFAP